jgi:beta-N-acetylhexosaminidase
MFNYLLIISIILYNKISTKNSGNGELFEEYYEEAEKIVNTMTLEEKVGQLFWVGLHYEKYNQELSSMYPGGYITFAYNYENYTEEQVLSYMYDIRNKTKIPLVFGVDEEGGTVCRVSLYFRKEKFPSPQDLYNQGNIDLINSIEKEKRALLRKFLLNVNFAPVADVALNKNSFIYKRTLGRGYEETANYIRIVTNIAVKDLFGQTLKHFPGYGDNKDTHSEICYDNRTREDFEQHDLITFKAGIEAKVPLIMVSHNVLTNFEGINNTYPSSINKDVYNYLRNNLNFSGLAVTDSLTMKGVRNFCEENNITCSTTAIKAGVDIILTQDFEGDYYGLLQAVKNKEIDMDIINKANKRVLAFKLAYKIIESKKYIKE